jgi:hypothetical protein
LHISYLLLKYTKISIIHFPEKVNKIWREKAVRITREKRKMWGTKETEKMSELGPSRYLPLI